jgi:antitoxin ParD1/3/4
MTVTQGAFVSAVSEIKVALTADMAAFVNRAVESGQYATGGELIREALMEWKQRRDLSGPEIERLHELWAEGVASGPGRLESLDAIKAEARRRLAARVSSAHV